jgi:uncharacterized protein YkwD
MMKRAVFLVPVFLFLTRGILGAQDWDPGLDTARDADYLSRAEKDVILEMNKVRSNPQKYAEMYVKPLFGYFNGLLYTVPGAVSIRTTEGRKAAEECYQVLMKAGSLPILYPREGLSLAARDHARDQGQSGQTGHTGGDGSSPDVRAKRYGKGPLIGENIAYGFETGRDIVVQLLIDDGVPSRGHRENIMNGSFNCAGVSIGPHQVYRYMCPTVFAGSYVTANNERERKESEAQMAALFARRLDPGGAHWDIPLLDTAGGLDYLSGMEKDVVLEINKLRSDPKKYAQLYLEETGSLAAALRNARGAPPLSLEKGLCLAARDSSGDLGARAGRYGKWGGSISGPRMFGGYESGRELVVDLLKNYRQTLLDSRYKHLGLAVGPDREYGLKGEFIFAVSYEGAKIAEGAAP